MRQAIYTVSVAVGVLQASCHYWKSDLSQISQQFDDRKNLFCITECVLFYFVLSRFRDISGPVVNLGEFFFILMSQKVARFQTSFSFPIVTLGFIIMRTLHDAPQKTLGCNSRLLQQLSLHPIFIHNIYVCVD